MRKGPARLGRFRTLTSQSWKSASMGPGILYSHPLRYLFTQPTSTSPSSFRNHASRRSIFRVGLSVSLPFRSASQPSLMRRRIWTKREKIGWATVLTRPARSPCSTTRNTLGWWTRTAPSTRRSSRPTAGTRRWPTPTCWPPCSRSTTNAPAPEARRKRPKSEIPPALDSPRLRSVP